VLAPFRFCSVAALSLEAIQGFSAPFEQNQFDAVRPHKFAVRLFAFSFSSYRFM
jgi:hypothetical protein